MRKLYPSRLHHLHRFLPVLFGLVLSVSVTAQITLAGPVFDGDYTVENQTDLDNFTDGGTLYSSITGDLSIIPDGSGSFTDFTNFSELQSVDGTLLFEDYDIDQTNNNPLAEFDTLTSVGALIFDGNLGIESITSSTLQTVLGDVLIEATPNLGIALGVLALDAVTEIVGDLVIFRNEEILDASFQNLTTIGGDLDIDSNGNLVSLDGFPEVSSISGDVILANNPSLSNVSTLGNTEGARLDVQNLEVINNDDLTSLGGTGSNAFRIRAQNAIIIRDNESLTSISTNVEAGISGVDISLSQIRIEDNPVLTDINQIFDKGHAIIVGQYRLNNNPQIVTSVGTQAISVTGSIFIQDNTSLTRLPKFSTGAAPTTDLTGDLIIARNPRLISTVGPQDRGLVSLRTVGLSLIIDANDDLIDLGMFRSLTQAGSVTISNNSSITNLNDFTSDTLNIDATLSIISNASLGDCCEPTCKTTVNGQQFDGTNDAVTVSSNTGDCADKQAVASSCASDPGKGCLAAAPVEWLAFTGSLGTGSIDLDFSTATESDNDYFQIERSVAGGAFEAIGQIDGAGDSQVALDYAFSDHDYSAGLNYYRIRQIDFDGTEAFSDVIVVDAGGSKLALTLFPNPANGSDVTLQLGRDWNADKVTAQIYSVSGQFVREVRATGNSQLFLPTADLQAGMYAVRVSDGGRTVTTRLTVR